MRNSKLYSILEYFNKYEQNKLRKYLMSPYFNKHEVIINLFESLINYINTEFEGEILKEDLWETLYQGEDFDDVRYRKHCSDLLKLVEGFLAQQTYEENPIHQATYLIEAVGKKKMEKLFNSSMKSARRLSEQQLHKPASFYFYQYQIEKNYNDLSQHEFKRAKKSNVEEILNNLDNFFIAEKLKWYSSVLSQQFVMPHEYKLLFIEEIISHIKKIKYKETPPISIYYQIYLTLIEEEKIEHYFNLKKLLSIHGLEFPLFEAKRIYDSALNYCIRKINKGKFDFLKELFDLYVDLLKKEIIYTDGKLSPWDFKNIVSCSLNLRKFDWTENFINSYNKYLPDEFRENAVSFNLAQLYFYQKNYEKVVPLLHTVEYEDFSYNLNSKSILLMTYYEVDEIEPLYSLMESFRAYLNRHKNFPIERRKIYTNLIKFTKKLTRIEPRDSSALKKLKEDVEKTKVLYSKKWLLEKIAELE